MVRRIQADTGLRDLRRPGRQALGSAAHERPEGQDEHNPELGEQ